MANSKDREKNKKTKPYKVKTTKKTNSDSTNKTNNRKSKVKKVQKGEKGKRKTKHPKLILALKICIIIFLLLCVIGAGIVAGMFFGLFGDEFEITKEELKVGASNTVIKNQDGVVIADLSGDEKRKIITLEEMADYLPKAYVAIEDERFYTHNGVDLKRTGGAILQTLMGKSSYGGSTITQQLVKNITNDKQSSGIEGIMRKVKEWAKAYQVERMITKDQILELYLNILYVGGVSDSLNLHGVELGAEYYFNKSAKNLDLAEAAFMAGINNAPSSYDPYNEDKDNTELIRKRTLTVLAKMKELGFIENEEEYNAAVQKVEAGLTFTKGTSSGNVYSYHTDAIIEQLINQVMEEKDVSREIAQNYIYSSGLTIYSTVDSEIQTRMEQEFAKSKYIVKGNAKDKTTGKLKNDHTQAAMAVIDYKTGNVLGVVGGLGEKTVSRGQNRATQSVRQCGSSMKPLATIAPGLQEKIITAATVYDDAATNFGGTYEPENYNYFKGPISIRNFIASSQNIPAVKIMKELTPQKSIEYLNKMGIQSIKANDPGDNVLALALGGSRNGATPLEMAAAYGTIANDGVYITPTFYTKVEDSNGNVVMTPNQEQTRVLSEQNAYIAKTIIQEPVKNSTGTARSCAISGIDTAAKTGTTDESSDRWLCGFTPYYSAACWFGYDTRETVYYSGNPAGLIWSAVMKDIHKNLPNASFQRPSGIVEKTVCRVTGCLPSTGCTDTYTEIFTEDNLPTKCEGHGTQTLCSETNLLANEYCPNTKTSSYGGVLPKEELELWRPLSGKASLGKKVTEVCTVHKKPEEKPNTNTTNTTNTIDTNKTNTNTDSNSTNNTNSNINTNTNTNTNTSTNTNSTNTNS